MLSILTGLAAGSLHVLSGPDHLAAVAPLAVREEGCAWRTGFRWGLGHSSGVILVGLLARACSGFFPIAALSSWAERLVGVVLVGIGIWGLRRALACRLHAHAHEHPEDRQVPSRHVHIHLHLDGERMSHSHSRSHPHPHSHDAHQRAPHPHSHAAFLVGTLHGAAGSSHLLGVLPSLAFPTWGQTLGYLASYGIGTILAMVAFATALGWLGSGGKAHGTWPYQWLMAACSLAAIAVGGFWLATCAPA